MDVLQYSKVVQVAAIWKHLMQARELCYVGFRPIFGTQERANSLGSAAWCRQIVHKGTRS
jgi:hypothetical protein